MKLLRVVCITYLVKTLLLGVAWLLVPDLPHRAEVAAKHVWTQLTSSSTRASVGGGTKRDRDEGPSLSPARDRGPSASR